MCWRASKPFPGTRGRFESDLRSEAGKGSRDNVSGMSVKTRVDEVGLGTTAQGFAIVVDGLRKRYGNLVAVDGISFRVKEREIFGLLGPNGAGKTTTVEILEGLRKADAGRAIVAWVDVTNDPQRVKSLIGVQLQASAFFDYLTLVELIELFAALYG